MQSSKNQVIRSTRDGNDIRIVFNGVHYEPGDLWCIYPVGSVTTPLGSFSPGNYTLTVDLVYPDPIFNTPTIYQIGVVPFTVTGAEAATPVPAFGWLAALVLLASVLLAVTWRLRRRSGVLVVWILVCVPFSARAQDIVSIQILLSDALGAPSPAQVVNWMNASTRSGKPLLDAFDVVEPLGGDFLTPGRAIGGKRG